MTNDETHTRDLSQSGELYSHIHKEALLMLDSETVKALPDLMANTLYRAEVARVPRLSHEEEQRLVASARAGDIEARKTLIVNSLPYVLWRAHDAYNLRSLAHDDMLDLAQVANLAMVEDMEQALVRDNPVSYLQGIARRAITLYCAYRASMISKPANLKRSEYEKYQQRGPLVVESLDAPLTDDGTFTRMDLIEAPASDPALVIEEEDALEQRQVQYPDLYQSLAALPPYLRETMILLYGLDGHPPMRKDLIGKPSTIRDREHRALAQLQKLLQSAAHEVPKEVFRWNPMTDVPHERGYIEVGHDHCFVMRDGLCALNWRWLEKQARQSVAARSGSGDHSSFYPLTWDLLKKADFPSRPQDKAQETYVARDDDGRFFVRHLERGKPIDDWREVKTYIVHDKEGDRYTVESKDGPARNWQALDAEARAAVGQMGEEFRDRRVVECPPELAAKAVFLPAGELEPDSAPLPWEEPQTIPLERSTTHDLDFGR